MRARLGRVVLVFALLLAQQSALAHQIWHASLLNSAVAGAGAATEGRGDSTPPQKQLCEFHTALGAVLGVLQGASGFAQLAERLACEFVTADFPAVSLPALPPASRGPPQRL